MNDYEDDRPEGEMNEAWWNSILSEEVPEDNFSAPQKAGFKKGPKNKANWEYIYVLMDDEVVFTCVVIDINRGGLIVKNEKIQGFVPVSHLVDFPPNLNGQDREVNLRAMLGKDIKVKVIECDPNRGRIVLSERAATAAPGERQKLLSTLEIGSVIKGLVTNITDFGVFVDLGGLEGLVHISELSWGRVVNPKLVLEVGDEIEVSVLKLHEDKSRISLSIKDLLPNPWEGASERYPEGKIIHGEVIEIVDFGAFVRIEENMEGLIHISELALEGNETPASILTEGQSVDVAVVRLNEASQRLSLRLIG